MKWLNIKILPNSRASHNLENDKWLAKKSELNLTHEQIMYFVRDDTNTTEEWQAILVGNKQGGVTWSKSHIGLVS
jgi:hypothetical protein